MGYIRTPVKTEGFTLRDLQKKYNCGRGGGGANQEIRLYL